MKWWRHIVPSARSSHSRKCFDTAGKQMEKWLAENIWDFKSARMQSKQRPQARTADDETVNAVRKRPCVLAHEEAYHWRNCTFSIIGQTRQHAMCVCVCVCAYRRGTTRYLITWPTGETPWCRKTGGRFSKNLMTIYDHKYANFRKILRRFYDLKLWQSYYHKLVIITLS